MTDNDRELLWMAARAAGYVFDTFCDGKPIRRESDGQPVYWNPLADDGDALRLAVRIGMSIVVTPEVGITDVKATGRQWVYGGEHHFPDPMTATRRAIVRAAAAIGESMK